MREGYIPKQHKDRERYISMMMMMLIVLLMRERYIPKQHKDREGYIPMMMMRGSRLVARLGTRPLMLLYDLCYIEWIRMGFILDIVEMNEDDGGKDD